MAPLLLWLIRVYQRMLSPLLGNVCRFEPSCSRYAAGCIEGHGALRGSLLSFIRLCKCHPFHPGGYDPVPAPALAAPQLSPLSLSAPLVAPINHAASHPMPGADAPSTKAPSNGS